VDAQPGSPAAQRGLGRFCVIREVDRRAISDRADWEDAFDDVDDGDVVTVIAACPDGRQMTERMYNIRVPR